MNGYVKCNNFGYLSIDDRLKGNDKYLYDSDNFPGPTAKLISTLGLPCLHLHQLALGQYLHNVCQVKTVWFEPQVGV